MKIKPKERSIKKETKPQIKLRINVIVVDVKNLLVIEGQYSVTDAII